MLTNWIRTHRLVSFFLLTYAISWSLNGVVIALQMEPSWTRWILSGFLSASGPAIAAAIVVHVSDHDLRVWARSIVHWRVHPKWYVAAIGIPAAIALSAGAIAALLGGPIDFGAFSPNLLTLTFGILLGTFIGGGQEEIGWRGFAQPELQQRYGGLVAAIVIGVLWGGWHLPLFFDPTAPHAQWPLASQLAYFIGIIGFSVLLAWVYNGSGGSILLVMIMHGSENALGALVPLDVDLVIVDGVPDWGLLVSLNVAHVAVTWVSALVTIMVVGTGLRATRLSAAGATGTTRQDERV
ncbi:CPBP family intramembrane glutamic endopeptidase [Natronorubrum texcoconense]|uniref:Membrane protease YdiL, CAAX protease family n=1 Tax=Natronorubrum texcoconense TaxID=1095776 RepID=A0A1G9D3I1_9EURY|nr:type II CAAX endopeptidase family protein [Natronorubrum texcoconense]SDK58496.1 Membrane protease YdiL, CAAX protease family [Natronorubrum texcoconense]